MKLFTRAGACGLVLMAVFVTLLYPRAGLAQTDPAIGNWKLNLAKSKYNSGPPPKSLMVTFQSAGQGVKVTTKGVDAEGKPAATEYTASYDGKDYSMKGSPVTDTVALRRIDASTVERTDKKAGKVVATLRRATSSDGKGLTVTVKSTNAKGEPTTDVLVFERQ